MTNPPTTTIANEPVRLFISYAHRDEDLRRELDDHLSMLQRQGLLASWHDRQIVAGQDWAGEIDEALQQARVILLLISARFLASDYCHDKEMLRALERHAAGEAVVIPVILSDCDWQGAPFSKLQALPKDAKPIKSWPDRDEAWANVVRGLRRVIESLPRPAAAPTPPAAVPLPSPLTQQGERNVVITGNAQHVTIITGDHNLIGATPPLPAAPTTNLMDKSLFDQIVAALLPEMDDAAARKALVESALYGSPVLQKLRWDGAARPFTVQLVRALLEFGQVAPGRLALVALLEEACAQVGVNRQAEFERLLARLG